MLIAALLLYGAACYTPWAVVGIGTERALVKAGFWTPLAQLFISALVANQAAYLIGVKPTRTAVEQA
jgi:hypothetical protein